ncbi:MAG TPA: ATP-dependent Clp protease proteolytic subunit [Gemmatimonadaceae bacterium]|nr:ATP-dependent Clp protease proteolytic subunit [Gemmatimonadaceae bacterium]
MTFFEDDDDDHDDDHEPDSLAPFDPVASRLLKARTIIISGGINQRLTARVTAQLLAISSDSSSDPITIVLNSQGGHVEAGDTIHDMIRFVPAPVRVVGTGWVASAAALIFVSVPRERRFCLPNTRFLLHQPAGGGGGSASDIEIEAREILKMRDRLNRIFARETGQTLQRIEDDTHRNFWLSADDAKAYGIVGHIIERWTQLEETTKAAG